MQRVRGVNERYRIKTEAVVTAQEAKLRPSGKLRSLVAVFLLGGVLLFVAVSALDAVSTLRAESLRSRRRGEESDDYDVAPLPHPLRRDSRADSDHDPETPTWPLEVQR